MTEVSINIETSALICSSNQWTVFYMIETSIMKEIITVIRNIRPEIFSEKFFLEFWMIVGREHVIIFSVNLLLVCMDLY